MMVRSLGVICTCEMPLASQDIGTIYRIRLRLLVSAEGQDTKITEYVRYILRAQFRSASSASANDATAVTAAALNQHRPLMSPNLLHVLKLGMW